MWVGPEWSQSGGWSQKGRQHGDCGRSYEFFANSNPSVGISKTEFFMSETSFWIHFKVFVVGFRANHYSGSGPKEWECYCVLAFTHSTTRSSKLTLARRAKALSVSQYIRLSRSVLDCLFRHVDTRHICQVEARVSEGELVEKRNLT